MDPLELVITNIKRQRVALKGELEDCEDLLREGYDVGSRGELRAIIKRNRIAMEALDYALSFLEGQKEVI